MKRKNVTRSAVFTSILSLLLCVSMLVGTTFAWFTDEVTTGMNTIAAGNLDIELLADGQKVDSNTKLFDKVEKWEPGVVVYENLQVANVGTLALKYQMALNFANENELNGHKLSEVLKIAVIDKVADNATREDVLAAAKDSEKVSSLAEFNISGVLEPETAASEQGIVIFWEPNSNEIDNLYNVNNGQFVSDYAETGSNALYIEFGVKLIAEQQMYESDSFGNDYDKNVSGPAVIKVDNADDLAAALSGVTEPTVIDATGVTIEIMEVMSNGSAAAYDIPAGVTIKGVTFVPTHRGGNYIMLGAGADEQVVFEDCNFANAGKNLVIGSSVDGPDSVIYNNCTFTGSVITNFVDNPVGVAEFNNCTFTKATSGIVSRSFVEGMGGTHNFNNCTFDYTGVTQSSMGVLNSACVNVYSESEYSTTVVLNNCTRTNCGTRIYGPNSTLTIK